MSAGKPAPGGVDERKVDVGEYKVNVATAGRGPTIVMLHGEGRRTSWRDWEGFLGLADSYRLVIPDLVGFGGSSRLDQVPDYKAEARVVHELLEVMKVEKATLAGHSWGGQVALEVALGWPQAVENLLLVASAYDKSQLHRLSALKKPSLIVWAEDDLVTQLKAGYLLRDAIGTSRLEVLPPVAKDPRHDFTHAHALLTSRRDDLVAMFRAFLAAPSASVSEPPAIEKELRGMALKQETPENWGTGRQA
ncbi:MAG: alpha/beta fold hydrolase [Nitrososphaerota archaeon]|nr:alpha/beta fold hydrolase [Nitrososphaerota archaeon]MDG6967173.1 alpha/beta fold hydrolase [Nitrososphaerota archaeon]MDG6978808.1 alpha/beta fold hydrolase [Nitrososphaerota archaeon]MDG7006071.1 alpha/beta fold hydrolase [Nitrososphaerota archaeon]MDG7020711.1 alpha/beta fold hydrolase [Nitrososphaerota archaeon]